MGRVLEVLGGMPIMLIKLIIPHVCLSRRLSLSLLAISHAFPLGVAKLFLGCLVA